MLNLPKIIQGGMGAGISSSRLARVVSSAGQLGIVSGTALDPIFARRLQDGDSDGSLRRALDHFPLRAIADRILEKFFIDGGKEPDKPYKAVPMHSVKPNRSLMELCIVANFVEVFLAREGHSNPVGINYLEKIQLPHLPSIFGAMLAGVGVVIVGAGIPTKFPGLLDQLSRQAPVSYEIQVVGAQQGEVTSTHFDPREYVPDAGPLTRPDFLSIISSNVLAITMIKRSTGRVDGFVIEAPVAGGHNAPPRGKLQLDESGQPLYGRKDEVDLEKIKQLGLPFWLAGGQATPEKLEAALDLGAAGIQVGTCFAFCEDSGMKPEYRRTVLQNVVNRRATVFTDPIASPTGFPFKVVELEGTLSEQAVYEERERVCDLGFLRHAYRMDDGRIGLRCSSEPTKTFVARGGNLDDTVGRKCLCNSLVANIGLAQVRRDGSVEKPLLTSGDDLVDIDRFLRPGKSTYTARDVLATLLGEELS